MRHGVMLHVEPPAIPEFLLLAAPIGPVDGLDNLGPSHRRKPSHSARLDQKACSSGVAPPSQIRRSVRSY